MDIATLKDVVNKTFTLLPQKKQRTSATDPVEVNLDSSVLAIQNSLWLQYFKITAFWLQPCLITFTLSLRTEISLCHCYTCQVSGAVGGLFCVRCYRELCTNCSNAFGIWDVPAMLQKLPRWHFVNARGQRCEQEPLAPTRGCVTVGEPWAAS